MNLYEVTYRLNSWGDLTVCKVVAASAAKAIDGANTAVWKSNRRKPHEITNIVKQFAVNYVQR